MPRPAPVRRSNLRAWGTAGLIVAFALAAYLSWSRPKVDLDEHGYDLVTALYRVCNQRSVKGLEKIEVLMRQSHSDFPLSNQSRDVLNAIVSNARAGQWEEASANCRQAMEDQVKR